MPRWKKLFKLEKLNKAPAIFDYQKLEWFNGQYIRQKTDEMLAALLKPYLVEAGLRAENDPKADELDLKAMPLVKERLKFLTDAPAMMAYLYGMPALPEAEVFIPKKLDLKATLAMLSEDLALVAEVDFSQLPAAEERFKARSLEIPAKLGDLLMALSSRRRHRFQG